MAPCSSQIRSFGLLFASHTTSCQGKTSLEEYIATASLGRTISAALSFGILFSNKYAHRSTKESIGALFLCADSLGDTGYRSHGNKPQSPTTQDLTRNNFYSTTSIGLLSGTGRRLSHAFRCTCLSTGMSCQDPSFTSVLFYILCHDCHGRSLVWSHLTSE